MSEQSYHSAAELREIADMLEAIEKLNPDATDTTSRLYPDSKIAVISEHGYRVGFLDASLTGEYLYQADYCEQEDLPKD